MKIAILTDTGSGMTIKEANNYGIYLLSLQIVYKDKTYKEGIDITTKELENILEEGEFPTTASPNVYEVNQLFEQIKKDGYDHLIAIPLTSGISGTTNILKMCALNTHLDISVIDCFTTCAIQKYMAIYAKKLADQGNDINMIQDKLNALIQQSGSYIVPDDMHHLKRGGRITPAAAVLANMLQIRPILTMNTSTHGLIDVYKKVRKQRIAMKTCYKAAIKSGMKENCTLYVLYSKDQQLAKEMKEILLKQNPNLSIQIVRFSAVITVHLGLSCVAIQYINHDL